MKKEITIASLVITLMLAVAIAAAPDVPPTTEASAK